MNIKGLIVKLLDGTITEVLEHDAYLHILVNGILKKYSYEMAFKKGSITAVDPAIQKAIIDEFAAQDRIKSEKEKMEAEDRRIARERAVVEAKLHQTTIIKKVSGSTKANRKGNLTVISSDCVSFYGTIWNECSKYL